MWGVEGPGAGGAVTQQSGTPAARHSRAHRCSSHDSEQVGKDGASIRVETGGLGILPSDGYAPSALGAVSGALRTQAGERKTVWRITRGGSRVGLEITSTCSRCSQLGLWTPDKKEAGKRGVLQVPGLRLIACIAQHKLPLWAEVPSSPTGG